MKKLSVFAFLCLFASVTTKAQQNADLQASNIQTQINADGALFWDPVAEIAQFKFPKPQPGSTDLVLSTIYSAGLWLGGLDQEFGALHVAAQTYAQTGNDFWAGPIASNYNNANYDTRYNRVWNITRDQINNHIANHANAGYVMPEVIQNWPAHGNSSNGEANFLAPFMDTNNNQQYNPEQGDYPDIHGDQAVYFITNDDRFEHTETGADKFKFEIHGMAYAFDAPATTYLNNNVFLNYRIINRSDYTYNTHLGMWVDFDIGQPMDDFVGCDTTLNLFYAYNGDTNDEGYYGTNPPAQGSVFLNQPMYSFVYYNNDYSIQGQPENYGDYYEYLSGLWKDGTPMTYGGIGIGGDTPNNYMFSGNPVTGSGWSEVSSGNTPADRRGLGTTYFTIAPNQAVCIDLAFPVARVAAGTPNAQLEAVTLLKQQTQQLQVWYNSNYGGCAAPQLYAGVDNNSAKPQNLAVKVYPTPTTNNLSVEVFSQTAGNATLQLRDLSGKLLQQTSTFLVSGKNSLPFSLANQTAGVYLLSIQTKQGISTSKITKINN